MFYTDIIIYVYSCVNIWVSRGPPISPVANEFHYWPVEKTSLKVLPISLRLNGRN